jgi:hypothetical protein
MQSIRPENSEPITVPGNTQSFGTILTRFAGLLIVAVIVLVLIWSR